MPLPLSVKEDEEDEEETARKRATSAQVLFLGASSRHSGWKWQVMFRSSKVILEVLRAGLHGQST